MQDEYHDEPFSVVEADFYGANVLMPLPDDELVAKVGLADNARPLVQQTGAVAHLMHRWHLEVCMTGKSALTLV